MDPRANTKFSTTYYKQSKLQQLKLSNWLEDIVEQVEAMAIQDNAQDQLHKPLSNKRHKHLDKTPYTVYEAITDLRNQLRDGKDITESMINRWNNVFNENMDCQIELVSNF
jgi:hypothetical protein